MTEKNKISFRRKLARFVGIVTVLVMLLISGLVIYLLTSTGTTKAVRYAINNFMPLESASLDFNTVRGNPFTQLTFTDIQLVGDDRETMIRADTFKIDYALRTLPSGNIKLGSIRLVNPYIRARELENGSWNLQNIFSKDTTGTPPNITIRRLEIVDGTVEADLYRPGGDTMMTAGDVNIEMNDVSIGDQITFDGEHIAAQIIPPGVGSPANILGRLTLDESYLVIDTLAINSSRTNLAAGGILGFSPGWFQPENATDFRLSADPVHFADLNPFLSSIDPDVYGTLNARIESVQNRLTASVNGKFSDDSAVNLSAVASMASDSSRRYVFSGSTTNLKTDSFFPSDMSGRLSTEFSGSLSGPALDSLSGNIAAAITYPIQAKGITILPSRGEVNMVSGAAEIDVDIPSDIGSMNITGSARPFDEIPEYDLTAGFFGVSLARYAEMLDQQSLSGSAQLRGTGTDLSSMSAQATLNVDRARLNDLVLNRGTLSAKIRDGRAAINGSTAGNSGSVSLDAGVTFTSPTRVDIHNITARNFDVGALLGDTTLTVIDGTLTAAATNREDSLWSGSANLALDSLRYGNLNFTSTSASATYARNTLQVEGYSELDSMQLRLGASAYIADDGVNIRRGDVRFENVNLQHFAGNVNARSNLNGNIEIVPAAPDRVEWVARLDSSMFNAASIYTLDGNGTFGNDSLAFAIDLKTDAGDLNAEGGFKPRDSLVVVNIDKSDFSRVNIAAFTGSDRHVSELGGSARFQYAGDETGIQRIDGRFDLQSSTWNDVAVSSGFVEAGIEGGAGPLKLGVAIDEGSASVDGTVNLAGKVPSYDMKGEVDQLNIAGIISRDSVASSLNLSFSLNGSGLQPRDMESRFTLHSDTSFYGEATVSLIDFDATVSHGSVAVESFSVESNVLDASATGTLGLWADTSASDLEVVATIKDARPLNDFIPTENELIGRGILFASVTGAPGNERVQIDTDLESVVFGDFRAGRVTAHAGGQVDDQDKLKVLDSSVTVEHFSMPSLTVRRTDFDTKLRNDSLLFDIDMTIDSRRQGRFIGSLDTADDERILLIEDITLELDDDVWELLQPTTIAYQDYYEVRNLLIFTDQQQIALDGIIDLDGEQSLLLTVEEFRVGAVADLFGLTGLGGTMNGYLDLTGPADAPVIEGDLVTTVESFGESYGDMNLIVSYDSLRLDIDARLINEDGSTFTIDGHIPVNLQLASSSGQTETGIRVEAGQAELSSTVDMELVADNFSLDWLLPFLDPETYSDIGGKVTGTVDVTGTVSDPLLDGEAAISQGHLGLTVFGVVYQDITGDIVFDNSVIDLQHVELRSGRGDAIATGTVNLSQLNLGEFDISISAEDFQAVDNDQYRGSVVADLLLSGSTTEPYVSGYVNVVEGEMYLTDEIEDFEAVKLTQDDLLEVERVFGIRISERDTSTFDFYEALAMDINVEIQRNMWLRSNASPELDIQFTGDLDVQKNKDEDLEIFGNIEVIPDRSRITELGKRFRIVDGSLTFNGPPEDPVLDIEAHHTIRSNRDRQDEVTIILRVKGQLDNLEEAPLDSQPEMDLTDILSYLAFGRPARESLQFSGNGGENLARDIALGQATGYLEGLAGAELGFDVFEIEQSGFETRLTAGKYLTQRLFVSVSQPISFSGQSNDITDENVREITAEFELIQHLLLKLTQRESLRFNVLWQYSY